MKFNAFALTSAIIGAASAQSVNWLSPQPGTILKAGSSFTATVQFQDTTSSVDLVAVSFGLRASNDPQASDIGQIKLGTVHNPSFVTGQGGAFVNSTTLTVPAQPLNGVNMTYQLTLAEFFLLGGENTPSINTNEVEVFICA